MQQKGFDEIPADLPFAEMVFTVERALTKQISCSYSYEQLQDASHNVVGVFVESLRKETQTNPGIVAALLVARMRLSGGSRDVLSGRVCKTRALVAELIAERYIERLNTEKERLMFVVYEAVEEEGADQHRHAASRNFESESLNQDGYTSFHSDIEDVEYFNDGNERFDTGNEDYGADYGSSDTSFDPDNPGPNPKYFHDEYMYHTTALELAVYSSAKHFLANPTIQQILNDIWTGKIVFWKDINSQSHKEALIYPTCYVLATRRIPDAYTRLRVPRYRQFFMTINYIILLGLYFSLLFIQKKADDYFEMNFTFVEVVLDLFFLGFVVEKIAQEGDRYWSTFDLLVNLDFVVFLVLRIYAYVINDIWLTKLSFDVLSLEAILLFPRVFALLSIYPYYGILLPCLKTLTKDFVKFTTIIAICYFGFLTTFAFLGRGDFTTNEMFWLLVRVFFGSSFAGFDEAPKIHPMFGSLLMLVFVMLTNVLLLTVLISILSTRFSKMMNNAREEYTLLFAESVVEATSDRVTYLYPPLNLLPLLLRPLRLFLTKTQQRRVKIVTLKLTHFPLVFLIWSFENFVVFYHRQMNRRAKKLAEKRWVKARRRVYVEEEGEGLGDGIAVGVRW
ncbi:hypothetical protein B0I72DRAFT_112815 [Yarrowia lipolytica]|uniref:YALI0D02343p n=2 Tax=Yarrowia lipolytica TaxID=4952 RepID=Q6CAJ0_YARLI|nr:YALI0D02343p [Yarrowia lipolytica CLIB122]AOW03476.1 hypothetical protein YALI1_D02804g [Yarrowia lipolytica]KAB8279814.1 hypothetical protein BKA91DRAFT_5316 [Yarrowia lipolytica]KAE8169033.1 hypothetical protein BKA90DRAFT_177017 [Yarrowia lipolytica]KAJ8054882.1 hypothetical protein LXG23DRAFT_36977 [Yarrowia lipolytica]RDW24810.1 hypothetical protein B0I71DRAFT_100122 [Yarrowia lipolytica]|eukprot:XP_502322.1 YALI0D02343p [Yarrowia lipolytica CLIB122]